VYAQQILEVNTQVQAALEKGVRLEGGSGLMELWDFLQLKCASYINSDLPGLGQAHMQPPGKPLRCAHSIPTRDLPVHLCVKVRKVLH